MSCCHVVCFVFLCFWEMCGMVVVFSVNGWPSYCYNSRWSVTPVTPGAVGLHNLGNTCFMNSALQCLSHTSTLMKYFGCLEGSNRVKPYLADLNTDNLLGTGGELATTFAELCEQMWNGNQAVVNPACFRDVICRHACQFAGYEQHDSQELIAFLLDGIHEDINRVRNKPYVEKVLYIAL
ncbi:unnamed protein product [Discosporangium mesarthrocarpum]